MALVKCPECGKDISDKSAACIHCGYPIRTETTENLDSIVSVFEEYSVSGYKNSKVISIYSDVAEYANALKSKLGDLEGNNEIAKGIIDGLSLIPSQLGWADCKLFCELIQFDTLSSDAMIYFAEKLYSVISIKKYYSDGSGGFCYIMPFFFAEYMVIEYAPEKIKENYMEILNQYHFGKQTGYEYVVSMYKQHASSDSLQLVNKINASNENSSTTRNQTQKLKCPVCSSTNIKRISSTNRLFSVATFGLASSKIGKQYECKSCKHKW